MTLTSQSNGAPNRRVLVISAAVGGVALAALHFQTLPWLRGLAAPLNSPIALAGIFGGVEAFLAVAVIGSMLHALFLRSLRTHVYVWIWIAAALISATWLALSIIAIEVYTFGNLGPIR